MVEKVACGPIADACYIVADIPDDLLVLDLPVQGDGDPHGAGGVVPGQQAPFEASSLWLRFDVSFLRALNNV